MRPVATPVSDPNSSTPHIAILMATYEGSECLQEQLDSLVTQSHENWQLLVSDDGSRDDTPNLIESFAVARADQQTVTLLQGPRQGAAANFMSLLRRASDYLPENSWMAFCDQDDVWLPDRLERGVALLADIPPETPALFCARTWVVRHDLTKRQLSAPRPRPPGFLNALAQNIAAGNTILLNPAAAKLLMAASAEMDEVVMHDWWSYLMVSGAGGVVLHDDTPVLLYRQHAGNEVGANSGFHAKMHRLWRMLRGDFHGWNDINIAALQASEPRLIPAARSALEEFAALRCRGPRARLSGARRLGLYRQSSLSTVALWVAALLGRL